MSNKRALFFAWSKIKFIIRKTWSSTKGRRNNALSKRKKSVFICGRWMSPTSTCFAYSQTIFLSLKVQITQSKSPADPPAPIRILGTGDWFGERALYTWVCFFEAACLIQLISLVVVYNGAEKCIEPCYMIVLNGSHVEHGRPCNVHQALESVKRGLIREP